MDIKEKIINNRTKILTVIGTFLILSIISGIAYAYFGKLIINNTANAITQINTSFYTFNSTGSSSISITLDQNKLDISNASNEYTSFMSNTGGNINITLDTKNSGSVYCTYDIIYEPTTAYKSSPAAIENDMGEFSISGSSTNGKYIYETDIAGSSKVILAKSVLFFADSNYTDSWQFEVRYYNLNIVQDNVIGQTFGGNIKVENANCGYQKELQTAKDIILAYNGGKSNIEKKVLSNVAEETNSNEGMYATIDDLGTSYFFRGAVDNNWLQYGEYTSDMYVCAGTLSKTNTGSCNMFASSGDKIYWRIVRINGDDSIRLIYAGTVAPTEEFSVYNQVNINGYTQYNTSSDHAEFVGYKYEIGKQHGTTTDSNIKKYLDDWFVNYTNLNNTGTKVTDQIFCNDRSASTDGSLEYSSTNYTTLKTWNSTGTAYCFGTGARLYGGIAQLICPVNSDAFTVNTINGKGNSALDYPVGLITYDEVTLAGNYLMRFNYLDGDTWIGSPENFWDDTAFMLVMFQGAGIGNNIQVDEMMGVRSVISLSSDVTLSGTGTWDNVYTVN